MNDQIAVNHNTALKMAWDAGCIGNEADMINFNTRLLKLSQPTKGYFYPMHVSHLIENWKGV